MRKRRGVAAPGRSRETRRKFVLSGAALLAAIGSGLARSQSAFPSKPVRIIVGFPPGQGTDLFARMLAEKLQAQWRQSVVVENRPGGAGVPAMVAGKLAAPDGHTLVMGTTSTLSTNPTLYADLPYAPLTHFAPVSNVVIAPLVVVVHPGFGAQSLAELIAEAKKAPGKIQFARAGQGTSQHLAAELLQARAGIQLTHVPYKGSAPALLEVLSGRVPVMIDSVASSLPHIKAGKVRALAVTTAQRIPQLPDVPTVAESGFPGFDCAGWAGIVVPAATPRALIERLSADIQAALADPALSTAIIARGATPDPRSPASFADYIRAETEKWAKVIREARVRPED
jgi:tripartite-type tricarboxylate transporter receptor subunit TctC